MTNLTKSTEKTTEDLKLESFYEVFDKGFNGLNYDEIYVFPLNPVASILTQEMCYVTFSYSRDKVALLLLEFWHFQSRKTCKKRHSHKSLKDGKVFIKMFPALEYEKLVHFEEFKLFVAHMRRNQDYLKEQMKKDWNTFFTFIEDFVSTYHTAIENPMTFLH